MQFKHPELLWALFLLLIPILIHLFQLRRFKKTAFTNVKFLKKVVSESRKSKSLKKWLLLFTRLLLFTALIIAFAQPFFAANTALKQRETVIYVDNSFSMQAKDENTSLLENSVQELLKQIPKHNTFSLFTNTDIFKNITRKEIQNNLLSLSFTEKQLNLSDIYLKANTLLSTSNSTIKDVIVVSDFQQRMLTSDLDTITAFKKHLVQLRPSENKNIALDSIYLAEKSNDKLEIAILLSSSSKEESTPISIFNDDKLIAKTSASFDKNKKAKVVFSLPNNQVIKGKVVVSDNSLSYDNTLYFNINTKEKIKVLTIGEKKSGFLNRIYTDDEFLFSDVVLKNLNYSSITTQNLIILNELGTVPNSLQNAIHEYVKNGGSCIIIPSKEIDLKGYSSLTNRYFGTSFVSKVTGTREISTISFKHPLYKNVFEKKVSNFQYPKVNQFFKIKTTAPTALAFADGAPFLFGGNSVYIFSSPISIENATFQNSPLIVPTLYNIGALSLKTPNLYTPLGDKAIVDIPVTLGNDDILKIKKEDYEFIPQQRSNLNKVRLNFNESPLYDGIYTVENGVENLGNISFNHMRNESNLTYLDVSTLKSDSKQNSITALFKTIEKEQSITGLWKWFVILALGFIIIEMLLQKFLR